MFIPPSVSSSPVASSRAIVISDEKAIAQLVGMLLDSSGMSQHELARRLGIKAQSVNQYKTARRTNPSVRWLARLVEICGGRIVVEFPR